MKIVSAPIRWAGSKRKLLTEMLTCFDRNKRIYVEPFLGSGIVLLNVVESGMYEEYYVNDINSDLIGLYTEIVNNFQIFFEKVKIIVDIYNNLDNIKQKEAMYYKMRAEYNEESTPDKVVIFWFIMKTCFNGIYRINKKGEYNVPFGKKENIMLSENELQRLTIMLENVHFFSLDFSAFIEELQAMHIVFEECFIYCDPPYVPETMSTKNQVLYTPNKFEHKNFVNILLNDEIAAASVMISMSRTEESSAIYANDFREINLTDVIRSVNPKKRLKSTELAYVNY